MPNCIPYRYNFHPLVYRWQHWALGKYRPWPNFAQSVPVNGKARIQSSSLRHGAPILFRIWQPTSQLTFKLWPTLKVRPLFLNWPLKWTKRDGEWPRLKGKIFEPKHKHGNKNTNGCFLYFNLISSSWLSTTMVLQWDLFPNYVLVLIGYIFILWSGSFIRNRKSWWS